MKSKKIIYLERVLRLMAVAILKKHKPKIVAVTGSVGKTSTKKAVFMVLKNRFQVRENQKNYNNEIGIPLTIIGAHSGGRSLTGWLKVFAKWIKTLLFEKGYPEILVLELGIDHIGDMQYLMSFIKPYVGVVTNVSVSHLEHFKSMDTIAKEKGILIESLCKDGYAVLNGDDQRVLAMAKRTSAKSVTFGENDDSTIAFSNFVYNYKEGVPDGISFKLSYDGKNIPIRLRNMLAKHSALSAVAAVAVGVAFKINLVDIAASLENIKSPAGRTNLFAGISGSYVIDDTYNASPKSMLSALDILDNLQSKRKIALLGDMLELGTEEKNGHVEIGKKLFSMKIDLFVAVGKRMRFAGDELVRMGFSEKKIIYCEDSIEAAEKIADLIQEGDFMLVKGSQGMRMEKVVQKLLAHPEKDLKLLCRQSADWKKRPVTVV